MKKTLLVLTGIMVLMGSAYAHSFNTVFKADSIKISASSESETFAVGENEVTIELSDTSGGEITDAEIDIYYYMPSMPSMNYAVKSSLKGTRYASVIKPVMPGKWIADIKVKKAGNIIKEVSVNFDVK